MPTVRTVEIARAAWGTALLVAPRAVLRRVHGLHSDQVAVRVARVLGTRHLTQAALSGVNPSSDVLAMGVWVDLAHAGTAVGLAAVDHHRLRAGLTDAGLALLWAAAGARDLRHPRRHRPGHDRRRDTLARVVLHVVPGGPALLRRARSRTAE